MPKLKRPEPDREFVARLTAVIESCESVSWLATKIGRSEGAIRKWVGEATSEPRATDLKLICAVTGTRIEWLVAGTGPRSVAEQRVAEAQAQTCKEGDHVSIALVGAIVLEMEQQLADAKIDPTPAKRADLVSALATMLKPSNRVSPEAIGTILKLAR